MFTSTSDSNKQKFLALVNDLAIYFPDYLLYTPQGHWNVYFEHKSIPSKGFYLNPDNSKGKFTVSPKIVMTPHYSFSHVYNENGVQIESPSVGFSIDRPAEQIAKGIKSRFIPDFEIYYSAWMKHWNSCHDFKIGRDNAIKEVAQMIEVGPMEYEGCNKELRENLSTYHSNNKTLREYVSSVRVSSPTSIKIETQSLNIEQARKLINFIKNL